MERGLGIVVAAVVAFAVTPRVAAQDAEIGSRLHAREMMSVQHAEGNSNEVSRRFAGCIALKRAADTRHYLDATDAGEASRLSRGLFREMDSCLILDASSLAEYQRLRIPPELMRGLLAEAVLTTMPPHEDARPVAREYHSPWLAVAHRDVVVEEMATCVAATNPAGIRAMLGTIAATAGENRAMAALAPSLGTCLAANAKLTANAASLRAALAEELYHRVASPALVAEAGPPQPAAGPARNGEAPAKH